MACLVIAAGAAAPSTTLAAEHGTWTTANGSACQLSNPAANAEFRLRSTGARNESDTTSSFIICPVSNPDSATAGFDRVHVVFYSIDGAAHSIRCTAAVGLYGGNPSKLSYSTKTFDVAGNDGMFGTWDSNAFGYVGKVLLYSVSCLLPPQSAISYFTADYQYEIGR